jgi:putative ABC transport system permease protein
MTALLLARRSLLRNPVRLIASVGGVALALSLTLTLDAIYTGVANGLTTYIDLAGADVWVSQSGVRNLHMVASWLPATDTERVRRVPGVRDVTPILYATDTIAAGGERGVAYVIGLPEGAEVGGPWDIVEGVGRPGPGEIVVDRGFAQRAGVGLGSTVSVLGREARLVGLTEGTASLVNSVAFVAFDDFRATRADAPVVSFVLVRAQAGVDADTLASDIERAVAGTTAQSRAAFAGEERRLVMDMSADVIAIMDGVGFLVALAVVALTVYVAALARRREYGVLKAIGAQGSLLYRAVLTQALLSVAAGLGVAVAFTASLGVLVPWAGFALAPALSSQSVIKVAGVGTAVALLAAVLPVMQVAAVDPAVVFRRGGTTL